MNPQRRSGLGGCAMLKSEAMLRRRILGLSGLVQLMCSRSSKVLARGSRIGAI